MQTSVPVSLKIKTFFCTKWFFSELLRNEIKKRELVVI